MANLSNQVYIYLGLAPIKLLILLVQSSSHFRPDFCRCKARHDRQGCYYEGDRYVVRANNLLVPAAAYFGPETGTVQEGLVVT